MHGVAISLLAGDGSIYALYGDRGGSGPRLLPVVIRFDPRTGSVSKSRHIPGARGFALVGGSLWVAARREGLVRLDPRTLVVTGRRSLGSPATAVAASIGGLWVGGGSTLFLVSPAEAITERTIRIPGVVSHLATSPSGSALYVETHHVHDMTPLRLEERNASNGELLASIRSPAGIAANALAGVPGGVWISFATGLLGSAVRLSSSNLRQTAGLGLRPPGTNSTDVSVAGGILWVSDEMIGRLSCADPTTGASRASMTVPQRIFAGSLSNVVDFGARLYVGTGSGLFEFTPGRDCRGLG